MLSPQVTVNYNLNLNYDGKSALKVGQETNKYSPTSILGVGWSLAQSKIIVDNKNTATREDDEFFLADGSSSSKLFCIGKNNNVWEFKTEKYENFIIKYHKGFSEFVQHPVTNVWEIVYRKSDYWSVVKDDGITYYYGYATNQLWDGGTRPTSATKAKQFVRLGEIGLVSPTKPQLDKAPLFGI